MYDRWQQIDRALLQLVGKSDSLNVSQLGVVLQDAGIADASQATPQTLQALRTRILQSKIGEQHIRGEWFRVNPTDPRPFVPGVTHLEVPADRLLVTARELAADEARRAAIVRAGQALLSGELRLTSSVAALVSPPVAAPPQRRRPPGAGTSGPPR